MESDSQEDIQQEIEYDFQSNAASSEDDQNNPEEPPETDLGEKDKENEAGETAGVSLGKRTNYHDSGDLVPFVNLRHVLKHEARDVQAFGHSTPFEVKHGGSIYNGMLTKKSSQPSDSVLIYTLEFSENNPPLNISELLLLVEDNNGFETPLFETLLSIVTDESEDGGMYGFQIDCKLLVPKEKLLNHMVSVSDVTRFKEKVLPEELYTLIEQWIGYLSGRQDEGDNYQGWYVQNWDMYRVVSFSVISLPNSVGGGCSGGKPPADRISAFLTWPEYDNNNCFFGSLKLSFISKKLKCPFDNPDDLRNSLSIPFKKLIYFKDQNDEDLRNICTRLDINLKIYQYVKVADKPYGKVIGMVKDVYVNDHGLSHKIFYHQVGRYGHYWFINNTDLFKYKSCSKCYEWFNLDDSAWVDHLVFCNSCKKCGRSAGPNHYENCTGKKNLIGYVPHKRMMVNQKTKDPKWNKNIYFCDFETFQLGKRQIVYSTAMVKIDDLIDFESKKVDLTKVKCSEWYKPEGLDMFMNHMLKKKGVVVFYNGSRFDFFFILEWCAKNKIIVTDYLRHGGSNKILKFKVNKLVFWDLCLFLQSSLVDACNSFDVDKCYVKKDFDHKKIYDWNTAYEHKDELVEYNKYDVVCMGIIYIKFSKLFFEKFNYNVTDAVSLSHMSHEIWRDQYCEPEVQVQLKLPSKDNHQHIFRALYGGRVQPSVPLWESKLSTSDDYKNWNKHGPNMKQFLIDEHLNYEDYLVYVDCNSLYPSACVFYDFPYGNHKFIEHPYVKKKYMDAFNTWGSDSFDPKNKRWKYSREYDEIRRSLIEVDVVHPKKNLLIPFLFSRDPKTKALDQDLNDKFNQVYDGITLIEAVVHLGYKITKIHSVMRWSKSGKILKKYMIDFHKLKQQADIDGKSDQRAMYKLLMNALTGKYSQKLEMTDTEFCYDDEKFKDESYIKTIKKIQFIMFDGVVDRFMVTTNREDVTPSKMNQIGVWVLGCSRVLMSKITRKTSAYFDPMNMVYYCDTDSLIVKKSTIDSLDKRIRDKYFGEKLGQMKDELPGATIVRYAALAPKTYFFEYISLDKKTRHGVIKHKGVPTNRNLVKRGTINLDVAEGYEVKDNITELTDVSYYLSTRSGEIIEILNYVPFEWYKRMYIENLVAVAYFGSFKRHLIRHDNEESNFAQIELTLESYRTINSKNWWTESGKRLVIDNFSVPSGHILYNY